MVRRALIAAAAATPVLLLGAIGRGMPSAQATPTPAPLAGRLPTPLPPPRNVVHPTPTPSGDGPYPPPAAAPSRDGLIVPTRTTDLAPQLAERDKAEVVVRHPDGVHEAFLLAPDRVSAFVGTLPPGDVVVVVGRPASMKQVPPRVTAAPDDARTLIVTGPTVTRVPSGYPMPAQAVPR
jgi:hypothetical protein